jgi:hypothetical protein
MSGNSEEDYEVGYRKPPVATRFKKGASGNPSGRPKKDPQPLDPGVVLQSIDSETIVVVDNGKRKGMTKAEIGFRQQFKKAIRGDLRAARLIFRMAPRYLAPEAKGESEIEFKVVPNWSTGYDANGMYKMSSGYKNPPKDSRFKKGQSGNPRGRPKRRRMSVSYLFRKVAGEQIAIEVDGGTMMMTRWEALLRQIHTMALNTDAGAARLLDQIRKQFPGPPAAGDKITFNISEDDARL